MVNINQKSSDFLQPDELGRNAKRRLEAALGMITAISMLDFARKLPILGDESILDALASGLNMLSEELKKSTTSREELSLALGELEKSNNLFKQILNSTSDGIIVYGRDEHYRVWNPFMERFSGLKASEVIGKHPGELFPFLQANGIIERIRIALTGEIPASIDFPFDIPDTGKSGWATDKCFPLFDANNLVVGVIGVVTDTTEQHEREQKIKESEARYRRFIETSQEGFIEIDKEKRIIATNSQVEKMFGYGPGEMLGLLSTVDIVFPEDQNDLGRRISLRFQGKSSVYEHRFRRKDGSSLWAIVSASPTMENGVITGSFGMLTDITNRIDAEIAMVKMNEDLGDEVNEKTAKLIQSAKMAALGEMAGGIAHEINNPLAIIYSSAEQLKDAVIEGTLSNELGKNISERILKTSERIAKIINGMRAFARNDSKEPFTLASVNKIIEDTISFCESRLKSKSVKMEVRIDKSVSMECRPTQISQVLLNLINNAIDAIDKIETKWIRIEVSETTYVAISVSNSGPRIPADLVDKVMQPFFTTKEVGKGTGLGLSIAQGIAKTHNGELKIDMECENTRFVLTLPKSQA